MSVTAPTAIAPEHRTPMHAFCDAIVPESSPVGALEYIDALALTWPPTVQAQFADAVATAVEWMASGTPLQTVTTTPEFGWLRSLVIEAHYSGYRRTDYAGPGGWERIGFDQSPAAKAAARDFTFLGLPNIAGQEA